MTAYKMVNKITLRKRDMFCMNQCFYQHILFRLTYKTLTDVYIFGVDIKFCEISFGKYFAYNSTAIYKIKNKTYAEVISFRAIIV